MKLFMYKHHKNSFTENLVGELRERGGSSYSNLIKNKTHNLSLNDAAK